MTEDVETSPRKILDGVRVLDLSRVMSGPFCSSMLADLGAEVIKIEMPGRGDEGRAFGPYRDGESTYFMMLNRGKKSVTIDMKTEEGRDLVIKLAAWADVLLENFRPGVMDRLGLGYETVKAVNPAIVYASISGFGQESPLRDLPSFDLVIQAMSGLMSLTGPKGGPATAVGESVAGTAGSWIYIGSQGIVQGTYETFSEIARQHFAGDATGRLVVTGGLGGMGGAQPLAATMSGFNAIVVECRQSKIEFRLRTGYLDCPAKTLDEALAIVAEARGAGKPVSVGLLGNVVQMLEEMLGRGLAADVVTDQTSAHDPVHGYLPLDWNVADWEGRQESDPEGVATAAKATMARHVAAMKAFQALGAVVFEYGNNLRGMAAEGGAADTKAFPGFVEAYVRPLFSEGKGPFR